MSENQRTVTLPVIPRKVAEAIEWARRKDEGFFDILDRVRKTGEYAGPNTNALRSIPLDVLASALVNGYTVEKSAEERAHDEIRLRCRTMRSRNGLYEAGYYDAVKSTLDTLGIKIEGVNA